MREHFERTAERSQVSRICGPVCDPCDQPLQIINRGEVLADLLPGDGAVLQLCHSIQPFLDLIFIDQRLLHIFSQRPCPHGGLRLIQHPEKGTSLLLLAQRLAQLQVPSCRAVQHHVFSRGVRGDVCQVGQGVFLRLQKILQERARADDPAVIVCQPQPCKGCYLKVLQKFLAAHLIVKVPGIQRIDGDAQPVLHPVQIHAAHIKGFIAYDLRRGETVDLIHELRAVRDLCHEIISCRDIRYRHPVAVRDIDDAHDIIVPRLIQRLGIQVRSRRDNAHHITLYDPFCRFRVFHLFADRYFISF